MIEILSQYTDLLPIIFAALMGMAMLVYVVLDGYDLGVGMLLGAVDISTISDETPRFSAIRCSHTLMYAALRFLKIKAFHLDIAKSQRPLGSVTEAEKDIMIASIGPFWDANETWLVLGIGILLVAFPIAHGIILGALYFPVALMLTGLILRGVAFDFRAKANVNHKQAWDRCFFFGSLLASLSQGYMLGLYIVGFNQNTEGVLFALMSAFFLASGYVLLGATWLIMKTTDALQKKAVAWAQKSIWITAGGLAMVSLVTPLVSERIFMKWFTLPNCFFLMPIPLLTALLVIYLHTVLRKLPADNDAKCGAPFLGAMGIFLLGFLGLAYSFYPFIVPQSLTIWDAASAPEALAVILLGAIVVLPCIIGYTIFSYRVFWGKVSQVHH